MKTVPVPRPGILAIDPYVGGLSKIPGKDKVIKLSSNESAFGTSPLAIKAYQSLVPLLCRYPDGHHVSLRRALAELNGIDADRIVCGNGSDDVLQLLVRGYAGIGDEVLYSQHGFLLYPIAALAAGATPVKADEVNLTASVDNLISALTDRTRIIFLANPNNPTGTCLSGAEIRRLHAAIPADVLLVIDAAYAEFVDDPDYEIGNRMVDQFDNVVVTRTFSKIYGLGGVRLGWAYCPTAIADVLNRTRGPFNVSVQALVAGEAALSDMDFVSHSQQHNIWWRAWLTKALSDLGFEVIPSLTNFVLVRFRSASEAGCVNQFLQDHGIIVRAVAAYGLPDCLRITIGREEEMQAVIDSLKTFRRE